MAKNKGYLTEKGIRTQKNPQPLGLPADRIDPFALWREVRQGGTFLLHCTGESIAEEDGIVKGDF